MEQGQSENQLQNISNVDQLFTFIVKQPDRKSIQNVIPIFFKVCKSDQFLYLKTLNLQNCYLSTIQGIELFKMPSITSIIFSNNQITSFKPLAKTNFREMKKLSFNQSFLLNLQNLYRMKLKNRSLDKQRLEYKIKQNLLQENEFNTAQNIALLHEKRPLERVKEVQKKETGIYIKQQGCSKNKVLMSFCSFLKLEFDEIHMMYCRSSARIRQHKIVSKLLKKYPQSSYRFYRQGGTYSIDYERIYKKYFLT